MAHLQLREGELDRLSRNYPDKVPVFISKSMYAKDSVPQIRKQKFLVPSQFTMAELLIIIRRWLLLTPEQAIFVFIDNILPQTGSTIGELHAIHKSPDGALRMNYSSENTFG